MICFPHCRLPQSECYYSFVHQCVACSGPGLWHWAGEHIFLCEGVMSMSRPWSLVWEKFGLLQCVFSIWPLLDLIGTRPGVEVVIWARSYVTPCRWQDLGSTGSCDWLSMHEKYWHIPTGSHLPLTVGYIDLKYIMPHVRAALSPRHSMCNQFTFFFLNIMKKYQLII